MGESQCLQVDNGNGIDDRLRYHLVDVGLCRKWYFFLFEYVMGTCYLGSLRGGGGGGG